MRVLILCQLPVISEMREVGFIPSPGMRLHANCSPMPKVKEVVAYPNAEYIIQVTGKMYGSVDAIILCE